MRLVASSEPGAVERDAAAYLLQERAVYTRAVCRELLEEGKALYGGRRAYIALGHLFHWISATFPGLEPQGNTGLDKMVVPKGYETLLEEIRDGASVCDSLFMLKTADHAWEADEDRAKLQGALDAYWEKHPSAAKPTYV
jgi:hypothetical protein